MGGGGGIPYERVKRGALGGCQVFFYTGTVNT